jgi:hypothetical protein
MMREAADRQETRWFPGRYVYPVVMAIVLLGGMFAAARVGIMFADWQGPPGAVNFPDRIEDGSRWKIGPGSSFTIAGNLGELREYDFRLSGGAPVSVEGISVYHVAEDGVELEILAGGDRRYLKVRVREGARDGEVFWLMVREFLKIAISEGEPGDLTGDND